MRNSNVTPGNISQKSKDLREVSSFFFEPLNRRNPLAFGFTLLIFSSIFIDLDNRISKHHRACL